MREIAWFAVGVNVGVFWVFVVIACRWSLRHAVALAAEIVRWVESQ